MQSTSPPEPKTRAPIVGVKENLVTIDVRAARIMKNELGYVLSMGDRLPSEVLRIEDGRADLQVFADTSGVRVGDEVELSGDLLTVALGPGCLGRVFDGLQNPLHAIADAHGFMLPRGASVEALDMERRWEFTPTVAVGDRLLPGQSVGTTQEGPFLHRIMVPFAEKDEVEIIWIRGGARTLNEPVARYRRGDGSEHATTMMQRWPVRRPIPERHLRKRWVERRYPTEPLTTTQRIIDTFFPIARGGTACIPGPFGAGKTVLQSLIARHSPIDIVVLIACGERAGEVVDVLKEYPETIDPLTGRSLMDRTILICNTSSMPVAAREASIFTGLTLGEYYRQMGYHVLCIADSTSRWAQAMRETSGRMEEIPGEEAFPAYLDSAIKGVYERAGELRTADGLVGSLTLIGTVSPAGGNFEEPVTQATLATVKTFLGLSADRAYKRMYPAIDPLTSWSRYLEQLGPWLVEHMGVDWIEGVRAMTGLLRKGDAVYQMMQVTGEEGISLEDYVLWQKSVFLDSVYLQQDAFDAVDASTPRERQRESFALVRRIAETELRFDDREHARAFFVELTALAKNLNYSVWNSSEYVRYRDAIEARMAPALADVATSRVGPLASPS